jgi:phosphatidylserine/phosphatidylglycerophosphate/cardiolipin synthase-like enzyme
MICNIRVVTAALALLLGPNLSSAAELGTYIRSFPAAQLYNDNDQAFQMRMALLDNAPAGARVKIATFVFDYGDVVRTLTAHACQAAKRGVQIELLVDSKSGDSLQVEGAWDTSKDAKSNKELYNIMADCGVQVYIHNENTRYVTILGMRLPNFFGQQDGSMVWPTGLLERITGLKGRLVELMQSTLSRLGIQDSPAPLLDELQSIGLSLNYLNSAPGENTTVSVAANIAKQYKMFITSPVWTQLDTGKAQMFTAALEAGVKDDKQAGGLGEAFDALRVYNRLNHRKIFLIRDASGEGCATIGGRNLGDHYLTTRPDSFHDGDVLLCSHLQSGIGDYLDKVEKSFDDLKTDTSDWELQSPDSNKIGLVKAIANYKYQYVKLDEIQKLFQPQQMPAGLLLLNMHDPQLLMSSWHPAADQVHMALLRGILQEKRHIWIETAYAELNKSIRVALEQALINGVHVTLVTNGIFISDGSSKLIGLWMAPWYERMKQLYPDRFNLEEATLASGRMIHFKGAGFQCQKDYDNVYYRRYMIGSHNFHPRSGYSDKENMLTWTEPTTADCADPNHPLPSDDLQALRAQYYQNLRQKMGGVHLLDVYVLPHRPGVPHKTGVEWEIIYANRTQNQSAKALARVIEMTFLHQDAKSGQKVFWYPEQLEKFTTLMENGGLRDMIGLLF